MPVTLIVCYKKGINLMIINMMGFLSSCLVEENLNLKIRARYQQVFGVLSRNKLLVCT